MRACLDAVLRLTTDGVPPSWAELGEVLSLKSRSGVTRVLRQLQARGYVDWMPEHARSLTLVHDGHDLSRFPTDELLKIKRLVDAILANRSA
jgi:SOS-response transcriptional repressor LexA